jgi:hypothetical protein
MVACGEYLIPIQRTSHLQQQFNSSGQTESNVPTVRLLWQQRMNASLIPLLGTFSVFAAESVCIDKIEIDRQDSIVFVTILQTVLVALSLTTGERLFVLDHTFNHPLKHLVLVSDYPLGHGAHASSSMLASSSSDSVVASNDEDSHSHSHSPYAYSVSSSRADHHRSASPPHHQLHRKISQSLSQDGTQHNTSSRCDRQGKKMKYLVMTSSLELKAHDLPVLLQTDVSCCVFDSSQGDLQEADEESCLSTNREAQGHCSNKERHSQRSSIQSSQGNLAHHRLSMESGSVSISDSVSAIASDVGLLSPQGQSTSSATSSKKSVKQKSSSWNSWMAYWISWTGCLTSYGFSTIALFLTKCSQRVKHRLTQYLAYRPLIDFILTIVFILICLFQINSFAFAKVPDNVLISVYRPWQHVLEGFQELFDDSKAQPLPSSKSSASHEDVAYEVQLFIYWGIMLLYMLWFFFHERIQWKAFKDPNSISAIGAIFAAYVIQVITGPLLIPIMTACFQSARCILNHEHGDQERVLEAQQDISCASKHHFGLVIPSFVLMTLFVIQLLRVKGNTGDHMEAMELRKNPLDMRGDQVCVCTRFLLSCSLMTLFCFCFFCDSIDNLELSTPSSSIDCTFQYLPCP